MISEEKLQERRVRFLRWAPSRVNKALKAMRLVGQMSNRNIWGYEAKDIDKIFTALQEGLDVAKKRFYEPDQGKFKL